ncbi:hypothetical protein KAI56_01530 [Candidatus Parcubacteria bacterium]|nr:hypothetical protein [Candidatus Parcubacteria bacterium]
MVPSQSQQADISLQKTNVKTLTISACFILNGENITMEEQIITPVITAADIKDNKGRSDIRKLKGHYYGRPDIKGHLNPV